MTGEIRALQKKWKGDPMLQTRRDFITSTVGTGLLGVVAFNRKGHEVEVTDQVLIDAAEAPVLRLDSVAHPVVIESIEFLKGEKLYAVRTRSRDGVAGIAIPNEKASYLSSMLLQQVAPFFLGKDARDLESLLDGVYVYDNNYKMQGLPFWCCVAWVEFSILDLLGRTAKKHVSEFFGGRVRDKVPMYTASGNRATTPEEEVRILQQRIAETGAKAVKFKVGGRMSRNRDSLPHRSEELIELSRKILGDAITIQADANGSYDVKRAIEIGRRLEAVNAYLFEEPCPFDYLEETKEVADALTIPISGGEQESSERRFRWMIRNGAVQIVQPDVHYYGGYIRATRVARMAAAAGLPITLHISGGGTGFADMANFFSFTPNMGRFQELKTGVDVTGPFFHPPVSVKDGFVNIPTGPGMGLVNDEELLKDARPLRG